MLKDVFPGTYVIRQLSGTFPKEFPVEIGDKIAISSEDGIVVNYAVIPKGSAAAPLPLAMDRLERNQLKGSRPLAGGRRQDLQISLYQDEATAYKSLYAISVGLKAPGPGQDDPEAVGTWGAEDDGGGGFEPRH